MSSADLATVVKQAVDIVDVVSQAVPLRRAGTRYVGLCPFHEEKTPSFSVDAKNQLYHCFGCGEGGDVISFVMKHRNLTFIDAVKLLAERYHIPLPETTRGDGPSIEERKRVYLMLDTATDFFYNRLHHSEEGRIARDYIKKRGLPPEVVEEQRLGYAPAGWSALKDDLRRRGFQESLMVKAGLLATKEGGKSWDRFRNRLIFPIRDEQGRVVAFGGRALDASDKAKYLNSPETSVYHKGRMLYQMETAREACRKVRQVILVEGYMDLLAFHVLGFKRVVATLGTAFTPQQARLLRRIADEVVMAYDGDEAGQNAMLKSLPLLLAEELTVTCLLFPDGMDPDDFLRAKGMEGLDELMDGRRDLMEFAIQRALGAWDRTVSGKTRVLEELKPLFKGIRDTVIRSEYIRRIAGKLSIEERAVTRRLGGQDDGGAMATYAARRRPVASRPAQAAGPEETILRLMLQFPILIEVVRNRKAIELFADSPIKRIAATVAGIQPPKKEDLDTGRIYDALPDESAKSLFTRLLSEQDPYSDEDLARVMIEDRITRLLMVNREDRGSLELALRNAVMQGDRERVHEIQNKLMKL